MAEQMFTELQEVLAQLREAREEFDAISVAKPGDPVYDDIFSEAQSTENPEATCKEQLEELVRPCSLPCASTARQCCTMLRDRYANGERKWIASTNARPRCTMR